MSNRRKLQRKGPRNVTMPPAISALTDRLMLQDAAYFRQHPDARSYVRPFVPGEAWPYTVPPDPVEVEYMGPGLRRRRLGGGCEVIDFDTAKAKAV